MAFKIENKQDSGKKQRNRFSISPLKGKPVAGYRNI